jgi:hypothetical protein
MPKNPYEPPKRHRATWLIRPVIVASLWFVGGCLAIASGLFVLELSEAESVLRERIRTNYPTGLSGPDFWHRNLADVQSWQWCAYGFVLLSLLIILGGFAVLFEIPRRKTNGRDSERGLH